MTKFKGPILPSWREPPIPIFRLFRKNVEKVRRSLPPRREWITHSGIKDRTRFLKRETKELRSSQDPLVKAELAALESLINENLDKIQGLTKDYIFFYLLNKAKKAIEDTGVPDADAIRYVKDLFLNDLEKVEKEKQI